MVKILHVEDNAIQRELVQRLLELEFQGCEVQFAGNGREGFERAQSWQPDIILMDLRMPQMDGFETIQSLKNTPVTAHIPIIAVSAWANLKNEERALSLGASRCLVKPFDPDELMAAIKACLAESQHSS
ncbi:MAG TPA: response regulator [Anaerolineae bacterium]|nr:response regulator [Anaerolineae bacterium]HQK13866.1 response regulator [Anaerolineae bacterium]